MKFHAGWRGGGVALGKVLFITGGLALAPAALAQTVVPAPPKATPAPRTPPPVAALAPSPDLSTTQGHLDAAQAALDVAHTQLSGASTADVERFLDTAMADLNQVLADLKEANAYVKAHPEINPLPPGPAPTEAANLKPPVLTRKGRRANLNRTVDQLNIALSALVNNPASDYHGPVLGDIGGLRLEIVEDIVKTGGDIKSAMDYVAANPVAKAAKATPPTPAPAATDDAPAAKTKKAVAAAPTGPLPPEQLKALVLVEGDYSRGTGFVAKIQNVFFIVTNLHVLSGNKKFTLTGIDGTKYPVTGPLYGAVDRDVAILKIPPELAKYYFEIQDDPVAGAQEGDPVTVPGNSEGAGVPVQIQGKVVGVGPEIVEVDAKFVQGNSGSPIIHRTSGKVIGLATYTITYQLDNLTKAANMQPTRWFGLRLDNIDPKQWEELNWARFSADGSQIGEIEDVSKTLIAFLTNQKLPPTNNDHIISLIATFQRNAALAIGRKSTPDYLDAAQSFFSDMQSLAYKDMSQLSTKKLYSYHANILEHQQELLAAINKAFATAPKQISPLK